MNEFASMHKPGSRLPELSPFELEQDLGHEREGSSQARKPQAGSAYGCVEWFQYLAATPASAPPRCARRSRPDTPL
jgi:hypothetical protein